MAALVPQARVQRRAYYGCAFSSATTDRQENGGGRARRDPSRQIKTKTPKPHSKSVHIATLHAPYASHLPAFSFSSFSKHHTSMAVQILQFIRPWYVNRDLGLEIFSGGPMAQWTHPLLECQKAKPRRRLKGESKIAKLEPNAGSCETSDCIKASSFENYQMHQQVFQSHSQPTKEMRTSLIMGPSLTPNMFINHSADMVP